MKINQFLLSLAAFIAVVGLVFWTARPHSVTAPGTVCTTEAKLCPDGSYVGRTGPTCEFATCPTATTTGTGGNGSAGILPYISGVQGMVSLGPTCPVERIPPDPSCADKPYATTVTVRHANMNAVFASVISDATGAFKISLPPGSYTLTAGSGSMLPRCNPVMVEVGPTGYMAAHIYCDTGIR